MSSQSTGAPLVGIFVGGRGTRLGGAAKGNLRYEGETLLARLVRTCEQALPGVPVVLVGAAAAYAELGLPVLADEPKGIGPLGGLRALLVHARDSGHAATLALACDLPRLGPELVRRLAFEAPEAEFVAPRDGELWDTLVARYAVSALAAVDAAIADGERALQRVPRRLGAGAVELAVTDAERAELHDWDTPDDLK
jgi:molybdopterin-guanine dinucleotide biosynthesis protein A